MSNLSYITDVGLVWPKGRTKRKLTDHIQVHHTVGNYGTPAKWRSLHKKRIEENGYAGVEYSYLILDDGTIYAGREHPYSHGGVKDSETKNEQNIGANQRSIAIAFNGDMRADNKPTPAAVNAFIRLCSDLMQMYSVPVDKVLGHNEVPTYKNNKPTGKTYSTLCPSIDMAEMRKMLGGDAPVPQPLPDYPYYAQYTGSSYANMREGESTSSKQVGKISSGEQCIVLGKSGSRVEIIKHLEQPQPVRGWTQDYYTAAEV